MGDVLPFKAGKPGEKRRERAKGVTLCKRGFHKWAVWQKKQFDVRRGKLVTIRKCERCGETKTTLD